MTEGAEFKDLQGLTLAYIGGAEPGSDQIEFVTTDGRVFCMSHYQDCCESVEVEEIVGDIQALVGEPILAAYETSHEDDTYWGSATWTFYTLATNKTTVVPRWLGESNGYYSEAVDFEEVR